MRTTKHILLLIAILSFTSIKKCYAQFNVEQQHQIDSLNAVIANSNSHDTSLVGAYVALSEILYVSNFDTLKPLNEQAKFTIEKTLLKNPPKSIKNTLLKHLANALSNIGVVHKIHGDLPTALDFFLKALKIRESNNDYENLSNSYNNISVVYIDMGNPKLAVKYSKKSLEMSKKLNDKKGMANSYNNIGVIYNNEGKVALSLDYFFKNLKLREELKDSVGLAKSYNKIGRIYQSQDEISLALKFYNKSVEIQKRKSDKLGLSTTLNNIGLLYYNIEKYDTSLTFFEKSLVIREKLNTKKGIAISYNNIGLILHKQKKYLQALTFYNKSLAIDKELSAYMAMSTCYYNIGMTEFEMEHISKAQKSGIKSLKIAQEVNRPFTIQNAATLLSLVYEKQGKGLKALKMYKLYITMRDSIKNEATQKATIQQQAKYEYEKQKAIDDTEHDKLLAIEHKEKEKQQILTGATTVGLILVVVFLIFIFNRLQVTKKQKLVIEEQKQGVEKQKEAVELAHQKTHEQKDIIEETHKEITDSINYAERIQRSFLATKNMLDINLKDYFVFFKPKDVVSGDFYWAGHLQNGNFAVVNADSTGHGVPGAIMSILNISSIEKAIEQGESEPAEIFNKTRSTIIERLKNDGSKDGGKDGMDASIVSFDFKRMKFTYTAANNPIWVIRNNEVIIIKADKMPVGKHDNDTISFTQGEFEFQKGDQIYTLTDGFQDQFGGPKGKKFMVKKMREYLLSISHLPMQEQHKKLNKVFTNWKGEQEQVDDVCVIGVKI